MLGSPDATAYDLRFRFLGIPVRVHPLFWLVMLIISGHKDLKAAAVFALCAFLSILVHEFGHGLSGRLMGDEPTEIVLYSMGGYCAFYQNRLTRWPRLFMLICGPGAGFVLFALVGFGVLFFGWSRFDYVGMALGDLLYINLIWGVLNLFPLWPLDGGQILGVLLGMASPRNGMRWAHVVSLLVAGGLALWLASIQFYWMAVWFGYFGFINYQVLQSLQYAASYSEDGDWWRR